MKMQRYAVAAAILATVTVADTASAELIDIELNSIASWAEQGSASNWVLTIVVPENQQIVGFGYDLSLSTFGPSWVSEAAMLVSDGNSLAEAFTITPGAGINIPGTDVDLTSNGIIPLSLIGNDPIALPSNAIRIEFFETFTDFSAQADAVWNGTLTLDVVTIPTPAGLAILGLAMVTRGRSRTTSSARRRR